MYGINFHLFFVVGVCSTPGISPGYWKSNGGVSGSSCSGPSRSLSHIITGPSRFLSHIINFKNGQEKEKKAMAL